MNLTGHAISYEWRGFDPVLVVYDGELHELHLADVERIDIQVGKEIRCIGRFEDGEYVPCPNDAVLTGTWRQCPDCARPRIPDLSCVFEPKCDGSLCGVEFCSRPHVVYLAITGNLLKIGMTSEERQRQRLIEQGADAYAILRHAGNRLEARNEEKRLSALLNIRQAHSKKDTLSQMRRKADYDEMKYTFSQLMGDIFPLDATPPGFHVLSQYPIELPIRRVPFLRPTSGRHSGRVLGLKGRFMIYDAPGIYAVDMSDIVGRRVKMSVNFK